MNIAKVLENTKVKRIITLDEVFKKYEHIIDLCKNTLDEYSNETIFPSFGEYCELLTKNYGYIIY